MPKNLAKHYYEEFNRINPPKVGSYINTLESTKRQNRQLSNLDKAYLKNIIAEINNCKKYTKPNQFFVPSPWHAWVWLTIFQEKCTQIEESQIGLPCTYCMPVYRGQANANQILTPSLYRPDTDRKFEEKSLEVFSFVFNQKFLWQSLGIEHPIGSAKAAAQHYGIKTNLLDVTADINVAIYFANHSRLRKYGDTAAVFVFDLNTLIPNIKFIFPPPIVERLYLQRGAFLELNETNVHLIQENCIKIFFPFDPSFQLIDSTRPNIQTKDKWFDETIKWSREWVRSERSLPHKLEDIQKLTSEIFERTGYPNVFEKYGHPNRFLEHWVNNFNEMVYWFAMRKIGCSELFLPIIIREIARSNSEMVEFIIKLSSFHPSLIQYKNMWVEAIYETHLRSSKP